MNAPTPMSAKASSWASVRFTTWSRAGPERDLVGAVRGGLSARRRREALPARARPARPRRRSAPLGADSVGFPGGWARPCRTIGPAPAPHAPSPRDYGRLYGVSPGFAPVACAPQSGCQAATRRVVALAHGPRVPIRRRSLRHHGRVPDARLPPGSRLVLAVHIAGRDDPGTLAPARRRLPRATASVRAARLGQGGPSVAPVAGPATGRGGADLGLPARRSAVGSDCRARLPDRVQRTPRRQAGAREAARPSDVTSRSCARRSRAPASCTSCATGDRSR